MLDFRRQSGKRVSVMRRSNRSWGHIVLFLGLAVILVGWIVQPDRLGWLDRVAGYRSGSHPPKPGEIVDNRLDQVPAESPPDTLISPMPMPRSAEPVPAETEKQYAPGVMANYLAAVHDDRAFDSDERDAWFNLFDVLNRTDESALQERSVPVTYAQLYRESKRYRGLLVRTRGVVRRVEFFRKIQKNDADITSYYRVCLFPDDNPAVPLIIYSLSLPKEFPVGRDIEEQAEVVGFYFKRWVYASPNAVRVGPTLLAKTIVWQPRPVMPRQTGTAAASTFWWAAAAALVASVCIMLLVYQRTFRRRHRGGEAHAAIPEFAGLGDSQPPPGEETQA